MKDSFGLSGPMIQKYFSSLIFVIEELTENLTSNEVKQQLSSKTKLKPDIIALFSKLVDNHSSEGQAISSVKKKALGHTLINFEYKFMITAADSHINKNSGKSFIHIKMSLLDKQGKKEDIFMELNLKQFYELYAELKRAQTLMSMIS